MWQGATPFTAAARRNARTPRREARDPIRMPPQNECLLPRRARKDKQTQSFLAAAGVMETQNEVLFEVRGQCALITLNRPDQRNAIDRPMCAQLWRAFEDFDKDSALRVAILTGACVRRDARRALRQRARRRTG